MQQIVDTYKELAFLTEEETPGVSAFRDQLTSLTHKRTAQSVLHESLISMLDTDSKLFRVLLIETNSTIPYTTVFLKLDCDYWNADQERGLRLRMKVRTDTARPHTLVVWPYYNAAL